MLLIVVAAVHQLALDLSSFHKDLAFLITLFEDDSVDGLTMNDPKKPFGHEEVRLSTVLTNFSGTELYPTNLLVGFTPIRVSYNFGQDIVDDLCVLGKGQLVEAEDLLVWIQNCGGRKQLHGAESKVVKYN